VAYIIVGINKDIDINGDIIPLTMRTENTTADYYNMYASNKGDFYHSDLYKITIP